METREGEETTPTEQKENESPEKQIEGRRVFSPSSSPQWEFSEQNVVTKGTTLDSWVRGGKKGVWELEERSCEESEGGNKKRWCRRAWEPPPNSFFQWKVRRTKRLVFDLQVRVPEVWRKAPSKPVCHQCPFPSISCSKCG